MNHTLFSSADRIPLPKQIARHIAMQIDNDELQQGQILLSINEFSARYKVARDTVEKAYKELKAAGYIISVRNKGYFVSGKANVRKKILLIFNKLSSYKKEVYYGFLETVGDKAAVDLQVHHYNAGLLKEIISSTAGNYHHYVLMPHFDKKEPKKKILDIIREIPADKLLLLDKKVPELKGVKTVYQDFKKDIYEALLSANDLLKKYKAITIVFPSDSNHPVEIISGIEEYCHTSKKKFQVVHEVNGMQLVRGTVYIFITEKDMAEIIKQVKHTALKPGADMGIISFNETVLKELLDITVITTDFEQMGKTAAELLLNNTIAQVRNPFRMIRRASL
ncbi:transcriptional regulator, GntR family [Filimonas lacunae]|uniref:Transcriptional regulator, GntR family n=2 Tax=Filimonas lacunae TaxID=477680 RepID=A0A173MC73_9BACT|nr:transcriptional regulator of rhamnose utilization, GntR family [Filimonas lacunae]SIT34231.1 transcriptional regulator, GntR family [Filimonas lacunae]